MNQTLKDKNINGVDERLVALAQRSADDQPTRRKHTRKTTPKAIHRFEAILEATVECLVELGYNRTNLSQIAKRAGVTRAALQYYANSTNDAILAATEYLMWQRTDLYKEAMLAVPPGPDRIERSMEFLLELSTNRYYIAWAELVAASRTESTLRPLVERGLDTNASGLVEIWEIVRTGSDRVVPPERRDAIFDIWGAIGISIALGRFNDGKRFKTMISVLKDASYYLWELEPTRKPKASAA